ncbi:hypothetical protein GJAV_G00226430, partial [Gymnothorax javanicus]
LCTLQAGALLIVGEWVILYLICIVSVFIDAAFEHECVLCLSCDVIANGSFVVLLGGIMRTLEVSRGERPPRMM